MRFNQILYFFSLCLMWNFGICGVTKTEVISRNHNSPPLEIPNQTMMPKPSYLWEEAFVGGHPRITKEFFRCRGNALNAPLPNEEGEDPIVDCRGREGHSLPLREGKEFIYPTLLTLLNHVQAKAKRQVLVTSGHRCPSHNTYVDASKQNRYSKHMVGAEVSFYVEGMEDEPAQVVAWLQEYYKEDSDNAMRTFHRYEKEDTNVSTPPWYNKEVFIKLFNIDEGRNGDNTHSHPYIAIQLKYDRETDNRVIYNWNDAHRNFTQW